MPSNYRRSANAVACALLVLGCTAVRAQAPQQVDWTAVAAAVGRPAAPQGGDVYRFNFPRTDLRVTASGVELRPAFALGGWIAMKAVPGGVVAMGDLVLTEAEVAPVMKRLQQGAISATAVHHHVLRESPRVMYMHVHAHGDAVRIGETIRAAVALTAIPAPAAVASGTPAQIGLDSAAVVRILGQPARVNGGVLQVNVPRVEVIREGAVEIPASMGLSTVINFQPTGGGRAAIAGDFVMIASEVGPVTNALLQAGIEVTALHNHMLAEEPRLFFMHFWAVDDAAKLATGLRAALDKTNSRRTPP